jgi:hypothetical protein
MGGPQAWHFQEGTGSVFSTEKWMENEMGVAYITLYINKIWGVGRPTPPLLGRTYLGRSQRESGYDLINGLP